MCLYYLLKGKYQLLGVVGNLNLCLNLTSYIVICSGSCVLQRLPAPGDQGRRADLRAERAEGDQRAHRRRPRLRHGQERGQSVSI